jgi:hypothetical protein
MVPRDEASVELVGLNGIEGNQGPEKATHAPRVMTNLLRCRSGVNWRVSPFVRRLFRLS